MSKAVRKFRLFSEECLHSSETVWSSAIICEAKDSETSKACELTGLTSPPTGCFLHRHMHSVACVGFKVNFLDSFSSNCVVIITLFITITSDVLIRYLISYLYFSYAIFKVHIWLFYQPSDSWISSALWSLVKPVYFSIRQPPTLPYRLQ